MSKADIEQAIISHLISEGISVNMSTTKVMLMKTQHDGIKATINLNEVRPENDTNSELPYLDPADEGQHLDLFSPSPEVNKPFPE